MKSTYLVLVGDEESDEWTVAVNSKERELAVSEYQDLKTDGTPAIFICTGDYITI